MSTTVSYKGSTLATVSNNTKTLLTEGKYLEDDITLVDASATLTTKNISSNGTYNASSDNYDGYSSVTVTVPSTTPNLQTKSKSYTPTTSQQTETVQADNGYDGLEKVNITVAAMSGGTVTAPASITATGASVSTGTNTLTLSKTVSVTPNVTTAGYISSGTAGNSSISLTGSVTTQAAQTIYPSTSDQTISSGRYLTGNQTIKAVTTSNLTADNIKSGVTVTVGDSSDADRVASVTGTYSGGGGSSKNTQVAQSTSRISSTTMSAISNMSITVAETGTYDIYYSAFRSSTSGTWSTQIYIAGSAYGSAQSTWSNHIQNVYLSNVSLTKNQTVQLYGIARGSNYYLYGGTLTIKQV